MALSVEAGAQNANNGGSGNVVLTLSTVNTNDIIVICATQNGGGAGSPPGFSDTAGLTWVQRAEQNALWEYRAKAAGTLSSDVITISPGAGGGYLECTAFAIAGADFTTIYDPNVSLPVLNAGSPVSVSTNNANDIILAFSRNAGYAGADAGFTAVIVSSFQLVQYKIVSATQSGLSIADPDTANNMIGDAIMQTPPVGVPKFLFFKR